MCIIGFFYFCVNNNLISEPFFPNSVLISKRPLEEDSAMLRNYLKVALRNIFKHKAYSFINIFGLALGMASTVLILLFVRYKRSYDRFHEKAERIQRIAVRAMIGNTKIRQTNTPAILTPTLLEHYPEVEYSSASWNPSRA